MGAGGELIAERPGRPADEDERLGRAAASGDAAAFTAIVARHTPAVTSLAAALLDRRDDVEDAVQETFLRAFQGLPSLRRPAGLRPWLLRIAVNVCRNRRRGLGRWRRFFGRHASQLLPRPADPRAEAEQRIERGELMRAVAQLPETLRVPFVLRFREDLTGAEIAEALGCSESTVWSRIYAARRELRKRLGAGEEA